MTLFSLQDGGVLGEYQEAMQAQQTVAAAAFSPDSKALCAVAYPQCCIIVTSPWRQRSCMVNGRYVCPEVYLACPPSQVDDTQGWHSTGSQWFLQSHRDATMMT